jgi:hypothetical protein
VPYLFASFANHDEKKANCVFTQTGRLVCEVAVPKGGEILIDARSAPMYAGARSAHMSDLSAGAAGTAGYLSASRTSGTSIHAYMLAQPSAPVPYGRSHNSKI